MGVYSRRLYGGASNYTRDVLKRTNGEGQAVHPTELPLFKDNTRCKTRFVKTWGCLTVEYLARMGPGVGGNQIRSTRTPNSPPNRSCGSLGPTPKRLPHILASGTTVGDLSRSSQEARVDTPGHRYVKPCLTEGPKKKAGRLTSQRLTNNPGRLAPE